MNNIYRLISDGNVSEFKEKLSQVTGNEILKEGESSLLQFAIGQRQDEMALMILQKNIDVDYQNDENYTALHYVAEYGSDIKIGEALMKKGANLNIVDKYGNTVLWTAIFNAVDNYDLVRLLLEKGASVYTVNKYGKTPYDLALIKEDEELIKLVNKYK